MTAKLSVRTILISIYVLIIIRTAAEVKMDYFELILMHSFMHEEYRKYEILTMLYTYSGNVSVGLHALKSQKCRTHSVFCNYGPRWGQLSFYTVYELDINVYRYQSLCINPYLRMPSYGTTFSALSSRLMGDTDVVWLLRLKQIYNGWNNHYPAFVQPFPSFVQYNTVDKCIM